MPGRNVHARTEEYSPPIVENDQSPLRHGAQHQLPPELIWIILEDAACYSPSFGRVLKDIGSWAVHPTRGVRTVNTRQIGLAACYRVRKFSSEARISTFLAYAEDRSKTGTTHPVSHYVHTATFSEDIPAERIATIIRQCPNLQELRISHQQAFQLLVPPAEPSSVTPPLLSLAESLRIRRLVLPTWYIQPDQFPLLEYFQHITHILLPALEATTAATIVDHLPNLEKCVLVIDVHLASTDLETLRHINLPVHVAPHTILAEPDVWSAATYHHIQNTWLTPITQSHLPQLYPDVTDMATWNDASLQQMGASWSSFDDMFARVMELTFYTSGGFRSLTHLALIVDEPMYTHSFQQVLRQELLDLPALQQIVFLWEHTASVIATGVDAAANGASLPSRKANLRHTASSITLRATAASRLLNSRQNIALDDAVPRFVKTLVRYHILEDKRICTLPFHGPKDLPPLQSTSTSPNVWTLAKYWTEQNQIAALKFWKLESNADVTDLMPIHHHLRTLQDTDPLSIWNTPLQFSTTHPSMNAPTTRTAAQLIENVTLGADIGFEQALFSGFVYLLAKANDITLSSGDFEKVFSEGSTHFRQCGYRVKLLDIPSTPLQNDLWPMLPPNSATKAITHLYFDAGLGSEGVDLPHLSLAAFSSLTHLAVCTESLHVASVLRGSLRSTVAIPNALDVIFVLPKPPRPVECDDIAREVTELDFLKNVVCKWTTISGQGSWIAATPFEMSAIPPLPKVTSNSRLSQFLGRLPRW